MSRNESCMNILTDSLDTHVVHPCAGVNGYRGSIEFFRVETFLFHPCNRGLQITHSEFELLNVETDLGGIDMCRVFHELITVYDILVIVNIFSSEYVLVSNFRGSSFPVFIFLLYRFINTSHPLEEGTSVKVIFRGMSLVFKCYFLSLPNLLGCVSLVRMSHNANIQQML